MEQANRLSEIARDTLVVEVDATLSRYERRKLDGICTRCGAEPAKDDSALGERCYDYMLLAKRRSDRKRRATWKRKKLCGQCGKKRRPGGRLCPGCTVKFGAVPRALAEHYAEHDRDRVVGFDARLEQSPDGKPRARRRFHGQGKRGRQSIEQLDAQDMADARRCVDEGWQGLAYYRSAEVQALPRIQREDVRREALAKLRRGQRWLEEIIDRHAPKSRKAEERSEDD